MPKTNLQTEENNGKGNQKGSMGLIDTKGGAMDQDTAECFQLLF